MEFDAQHIFNLMEFQERNYSLRPRHPERDSVYADFRARSDRFRAHTPHWRELRYAEPDRCVTDWFPPHPDSLTHNGRGGFPLLVFIHGGFWRALDHRLFSFIAEEYNRLGIAVAMMGYQLAPEVRVTDILGQITQAMRLLNSMAGQLGFDARRVCMSGHSAGGQLAAMLSGIAPQDLGGHPFVATVPVSGVFALLPLLLTSVNHDVRMTPDEALRMSPSALPRFHSRSFVVAVGGRETDGFISQSRDFVDTVNAAGLPAELRIVADRTHFDVLDELAQPHCHLFQTVRNRLLMTAHSIPA